MHLPTTKAVVLCEGGWIQRSNLSAIETFNSFSLRVELSYSYIALVIRIFFLLFIYSLFVSSVYSDSQVTIGLLSELTGPGAPNGKTCNEGYRVAELLHGKELSKRVRLVFGDHKGESRVALEEYNRMVNLEGASAIISNRGHIGMVLDPISKRDQIPLLGIMGHADFTKNNPYGFRFWVPLKADGQALAREVANRELKRLAIVALHDDYILSLVDYFKREFISLGGEVVFTDTIEKSQSDFSSILSKVKSVDPDLIFLNGSVGQLGLLVRKARELGLKQQIISNFWIGYDDVIRSAGTDNIEGALYISIDLDKQLFLKGLEQINPDSIPTAVTYACYSALSAVYQVVKREPKIRDKEGLFRVLQEIDSVSLPDGEFRLIDREVYFDLSPYLITAGQPKLKSKG